MVNQIYPPEQQLNKSYTSDTETTFLDLHISIFNGFVFPKIYDKRVDFDFDIHVVNFSFLDGDVPRCPSYGVYAGGGGVIYNGNTLIIHNSIHKCVRTLYYIRKQRSRIHLSNDA